jgi:ADP-ribosylglycohydrolase
MTTRIITHGEEEAGGSGMPSIADRFRGAIWGAFVGDAACLGSHWIYNLEELARRFPGGVTGFEAPAEGHYHYGKQPGDLTHYGDAALLLLQSVAERGGFDPVDFGCRFVALFGSDAYQGYRDHATKDTLKSYEAFVASNPEVPYHFQGGGNDDQPATVTRLAPVVVAHRRDSDLSQVVASVTRVSQFNDRAVAYAKGYALILRALFAGNGMESAFRTAERSMARESSETEVSEAIAAGGNAVSLTVREATLKFGQSCPLAHSFPAAVQCALKYDQDFARAITETANAGGDNAGRAAMIGAWLGAVNGVAGIPSTWRNRLNRREEIDTLIERIADRAVKA